MSIEFDPAVAYHCSRHPDLPARLRPVRSFGVGRPVGLWFARGDTSLRFCERSDPRYAVAHPYWYRLSINDDLLLIIGNAESQHAFTARYAAAVPLGINWVAVRRDYAGMEITTAELIQNY